MSNETESSLPPEAAHDPRSSPPFPTQHTPFEMDDSIAPKSEPAATHDAQQTPKLSKHKRLGSDDTARPASAQHDRDSSEEHSDVEGEHEPSDDEDANPAAKIAAYDWDDLHRRYHEAIKGCSADEAALAQEWMSLMDFFSIWAGSGHEHETTRTFQRLQTRTQYVQHEEQTLENKRDHYINVVRAFESALNLLKAT